MIAVGIAVLFSVQLASRVTGVMLGERELDILLAVAPERLPHEYIRGQLVFLATGQPVLYLEDDLEELTGGCLQAIVELRAGRPTTVSYSDAPGRVRFTPVGDLIRISGDFATFEAPAAELFPALRDCCMRYIAFARTALPDESALQDRLSQLDYWADQAR